MTYRSWLATSFIAAVTVGQASAQPAANANNQKREFLAQAVKERLDTELAKTTFNLEQNGRHTSSTDLPFNQKLVVHTDWSVKVNGNFIDPTKRSSVEVTKLERQPDGSNLVTLTATAPIAGVIWGEIKTVGKTKFDFESTAKLELQAKLKRKPGKAGEDGEFEAVVVGWKGSFDDVKLRPDLAGLIAGEAKRAANKSLADKNEEIKKKVNEALIKAAVDKKLRLDP